MKKYLVIGNPVEHSLSPKLHNYWFKKNKVDAIYEKKQINLTDIKEIVDDIRKGNILGVNVTVPFKKAIIPFLDEMSPLAKETQSVNTIYKEKEKVIGENTDVYGFSQALNQIKFNIEGKKFFILGSGGVVPSLVVALKKSKASKIIISNRTKEKAEILKKTYPFIEIVEWGRIKSFDMIINATSLGLKDSDEIPLDYKEIGKNKLFYDVIYNPKKTKFLLKAKEFGNKVENGKTMFAYQAQLAFQVWHNIKPVIDNETLELLEDD